MGSLMAGWDSPNLDLDGTKVLARKNRSLTKEEIQAFWKQQQKADDGEGSEQGSPVGSRKLEAGAFMNLEKRMSPMARAKSMPSSPVTRVEGFDVDEDDKAKKSNDWWTKSNWAFLNEPPQEEVIGQAHRYSAQFHVARIATGNA